MFDADKHLLRLACLDALAQLEGDEPSAAAWMKVRRALDASRGEEPDLSDAIELEDVEELRSIVDGWTSGDRLLPEQDRTILKRALKSFRKRLKLTRLDDESKVGGGPMSSGQQSSIVAITPPEHYGPEVWNELVRLGRLIDARQGMYELPPE